MRMKKFEKNNNNVYSSYLFTAVEEYIWEYCLCLAGIMWGGTRGDTAKVRVYDKNNNGKYVEVESIDDFFNIPKASVIEVSGVTKSSDSIKYAMFIKEGSDEVRFDVDNTCIDLMKNDKNEPATPEEQAHYFDSILDKTELVAFVLYTKKRVIRKVLEELELVLPEFVSPNYKSSVYGYRLCSEIVDLSSLVNAVKKGFAGENGESVFEEEPLDMYKVFERLCSPEDGVEEEDESEDASDV